MVMNSNHWGRRAGGILFVACNTGRVLLTLRSMEVYAPGTWSIPGGKIDDGESILDGAIREAEEEVGYDGDLNVERLSVFRDGDFEFHTFLGAVPDEFEPSLNWENDDYTWATIDSMPSPLHFGVQAMLKSVPKKVLTRRIDKVCRL